MRTGQPLSKTQCSRAPSNFNKQKYRVLERHLSTDSGPDIVHIAKAISQARLNLVLCIIYQFLHGSS